MILTIDTDKLKELVTQADKIFMSPEGDEALASLIEIEAQVKEAREAAEKTLEQAALAINPDFKSIQSDRVKVMYKTYGSRFYLDETNLDKVPKELYTTETKYKVDSKAVEKYVDEHKGIPVGINEVERTKKLSFSLKKGTDTNE
jgi:hypothetical protein